MTAYALPWVGTRRRRRGPREKMWLRILLAQLVCTFVGTLILLDDLGDGPSPGTGLIALGWVIGIANGCSCYWNWRYCRDKGL